MKHTYDDMLDIYIKHVSIQVEGQARLDERRRVHNEILTDALNAKNKGTILWLLKVLLKEQDEIKVNLGDLEMDYIEDCLHGKFKVQLASNSHVIIRK